MVLTGFLRSKSFQVDQFDLSIALINKLFTQENCIKLFDIIQSKRLSKRYLKMLARRIEYEEMVEPVMLFLHDPQYAQADLVSQMHSLPQSDRFKTLKNHIFVSQDSSDLSIAMAKATFFIQDLSDLIRDLINPHFELIRYGEKISSAISDFKQIRPFVDSADDFVNELMLQLLKQKIMQSHAQLVGFSIPFPGNFYATLICARWIKAEFPMLKIVMGGGFVNTELRQMTQKDLFDFTDYLVFDDGELPLQRIIEFENGQVEASQLLRTWVLKDQQILKYQIESRQNIPFNERSYADYSDIERFKYISLMETPNPMHNLWSVGFWNKMTLAHGCYWAQCSFCDTNLDYIQRFEPAKVDYLVDQMEAIMQQTACNGFHFTDEAAPPALLKRLSEEIIRRKLKVRWWGNIRFEKNFTAELAGLMAQAGCIAVSGGLETVSPRLLLLINKGVDIESATICLQNFKATNIMVHAYLMYGFPSQTAQETVDALEIVRQWFMAGLLQSGFWHRYAMTLHSPSFHLAQEYGLKNVMHSFNPFANNEVFFEDSLAVDHQMLGLGLQKALYNFMLANGFELDIGGWFESKVPKVSVNKNLINQIIDSCFPNNS
jgi:hypothetical protein